MRVLEWPELAELRETLLGLLELLLVQLGRRYDAQALRRFAPPKRHALVAAFLVETRKGLLDQVVPAYDVYAAARRKVEPFVGGPAYALRAAKEAIDRGLDNDLETGLAIEAMQFAGVFATKDREIGMTSFVKEGPGKASFEGR